MLQRQGKQREKGEGEATFVLISPMLQKLEDACRQPGFTEADWMTFVHYLAGITSLIEFKDMMDPDEPIMERLQWLMPQPGRETWEWSAFINYVMEIDRASQDQGNNTLVKMTKGEEPSLPDTLQRAEESLMLPHQPDETSAVEEKRWNTAMRLKKLLLVTMSSTSLASASRGMEDGIATFKDRVNIQKIHNVDL